VISAVAVPVCLAGGFVLGAWLVPEPGAPPSPRSEVAVAAAADSASGVRATLVANVRDRSVSIYRRPGAPRAWRTLSGRAAERTPRVFLVRGMRPGWLRVALPIRPNGSTGWIRGSSARLAQNDFRIRVALRAHRLTVWRAGRLVQRERIGVGRAATPTPTGRFYVTELLRQPDPRGVYGPYAFAISAHSRVLTRFAGGHGEVGMHGTNDPAGLGHDVSHGCIRLANAAITRLARVLPLGTPVTISR
jgi:lipoprotein-anchoring transpeptidase ErfK/SrfK